MKPKLAFALALALGCPAAFGQGLGLDLSGQSKPPPAQPPPPPVEPPLDVPVEQPKGHLSATEEAAAERAITEEDRVKAVQRKVFLKTHRFELSGFFGGTVNDPFYGKAAESAKLTYFFGDSIGLGVRVMPLQVYPTDDVALAKSYYHSRIFYSQPNLGGLAELEWSAIYGKVTIFNAILHFDGFVIGGAGMVNTQSSGWNPGADVGIGLRFAVRDWLAVTAAYLDVAYVDTPTGPPKSTVQNMQIPMIGLSLYFPFSSTGRESE